jgi:hypothetical protein
VTEQFQIAGGLGEVRFNISRERFQELELGKEVLLAISEVEQALDLLCQSILDFEEFLLVATIRGWYSPEYFDDRDRYYATLRSKINLKTLTILTCLRAYDDQSCKKLSTLRKRGGPDLLSAFENHKRTTHAANFSYRLVAQLRNHAQHHSLPIGPISISSKSLSSSGEIDTAKPRRIRYTASPYLSIEELLKSDGITGPIRREISELGAQRIDLKYVVRSFSSELVKSHNTLYKEFVKIALPIFDKFELAHSEFEQSNGGDARLLSLLKFDDGELLEEIHVGPGLLRRMVPENPRWLSFPSLWLGHISSEIENDRDTFPQGDDELWIS